MIRLVAVTAFALAVATSAQAMSPVPLHQSDGMSRKSVTKAIGTLAIGTMGNGYRPYGPPAAMPAEIYRRHWY